MLLLHSGHGPTIHPFRLVMTCPSPPRAVQTLAVPSGWGAPALWELLRLGFLAIWCPIMWDQTERPAVVHSLWLHHRRKLNWLCMGCSSQNLLVLPYILGFSRWWQIDCLMIYTQEPQTLLLKVEFLTQILSLELFFFPLKRQKMNSRLFFCIKLNVQESCWEGENEKKKVQAHLRSY